MGNKSLHTYTGRVAIKYDHDKMQWLRPTKPIPVIYDGDIKNWIKNDGFKHNPNNLFILPHLSDEDIELIQSAVYCKICKIVYDKYGHVYQIYPIHPFTNKPLHPINLNRYYK